MRQYEDLKRLVEAVHAYRTKRTIPADAEELDAICTRILENDTFDETAIEWKRISEYEREVNGGSWPKPD